MNHLIEFFARRGLLSDLITIFVVLLGIYSALIIQREAFPNVSYEIIMVTTIYPGASAEEMEKLITNPLEQDVMEVDGIKKMHSVSVENRSLIILQIDPDQATEEEVKSDVKEVVDKFTDLPENAEDPVVQVIKTKIIPIVEIALSSEMPEEKLRAQVKYIEKELKKIREVAGTDFNGLRDFEIKVVADLGKLRRNHISLAELLNALKLQNISIPGGTMKRDEGNEVIIRTIGEFNNIKDVENTVIRANELGRSIKVKDVAKVHMELEKATLRYRADGIQAMSITVSKKEKADALNLVDNVKARLEEMQGDGSIDPSVKISYLNDMSYYVRRRLGVLTNNMLIGLGLVLLVLSLILPWRLALVTAIGIPFAFLGTLAIFNAASISFNLISMVGLIIVVGMLVDDAIVITENAHRNIEEGKAPLDAAIHGTKQVWAPVFASVTTTIMAFLPLMFMTGIMGKFVKYIPIGVILALALSLYECFFILPHHVGKWVKVHRDSDGKQHKAVLAALWDKFLIPGYEKYVCRIIHYRYLVALAAISIFAATIMFAGKYVKFSLFPKDAIEAFQVNIETPTGTPLEKTYSYMEGIEREIATLPPSELKNFSTIVGRLMRRPDDPASKIGGEYAQIMVFLTPATERARSALEILTELKERVGLPEGLASIMFKQVESGPPVGTPVSIGVRGNSYENIMAAVNDLEAKIKAVPGFLEISNTYVGGKTEFHIKINQTEAKAAKLSAAEIGRIVRAAYEGEVATSIKKLDEEVDIRVMLDEKNMGSMKALLALKIPNQMGNLVSLHRVAKVIERTGISAYEHEANQRQVRITGDVDPAILSSNEGNSLIRKMIPEMKKNYPGTDYFFGGENADTKESFQALGRAFAIAIIGIYFIMVLIFNSYFRPMLVLSTIPLGIIGVIWAFYLHGLPLSFLAMMGIVALAGVTVNNGIIFVDFVNKERALGNGPHQSIINAARLRIRPIMLTTITTVCGILPTAYGIGGLDPFVVPIAMSLGYGILVGSTFTLLVFPSAFAISDDMLSIFTRIPAWVFRFWWLPRGKPPVS